MAFLTGYYGSRVMLEIVQQYGLLLYLLLALGVYGYAVAFLEQTTQRREIPTDYMWCVLSGLVWPVASLLLVWWTIEDWQKKPWGWRWRFQSPERERGDA